MKLLLGLIVLTLFAVTTPAQSCDLNATTATFAAQMTAATAGQTVCLATGNYGTWNGVNKSAPGVTVTKQAGATPTIAVNFLNSPGASWLILDHLTIPGGTISGPTHNVTFQNNTWTNKLIIYAHAANNACGGCVAMNNSAILFNNELFNMAANQSGAGGYEGRIQVLDGGPTPAGVTITNSRFTTGCADGIQFGGVGPGYGMVIGPGNEFDHLLQGSCGPHVDSIQFDGTENSANSIAGPQIIGNFFHDDTTGVASYDNENNMYLGGNVFKTIGSQTTSIQIAGFDSNTIVEHNVVIGDLIMCGITHENNLCQAQFKNNIANGFTFYMRADPTYFDYNLCTAGSCAFSSYPAGTHSLTGTPTYVGGAGSATYAGYALTVGSLGHNASSTGTDMGINFLTTTAYGFTFPNVHPRLFWTAPRIAQAQAWVTATGYTAITTAPRPLDHQDIAFACLIMNNATSCANGIADAVAFAPTTNPPVGAGDDNMRALGESVFIAYDWLYPGCGKAQCLTAGQATTIRNNWYSWQGAQDGQSWGNTGQPTNNYFAGYVRNNILLGIASYTDDPTNAGIRLSYGINDRWNALTNFASPTGTGLLGKLGYALVNQEGGDEYGRYSLNYYALMNASSALINRDLFSETRAFQSGVLQTIYNTMLQNTVAARNTLTTVLSGSGNVRDGFPWGDDEVWEAGSLCSGISHNGPDGHGGCMMSSQYYGDFMQAAATEYSGINVGKYARSWIASVSPAIGPIFASVDQGGSTLPISNLPLDYYSSGAKYLYAHDCWTSTCTSLLLQMGLNQGGSGHLHQDAGTFQINRKGVNIVRETPGYNRTIAGYNDVGTVGADIGFAHNIPLVGGLGSMSVNSCTDGPGLVQRLETQNDYVFAEVDLTLTYQNTICDSGHSSRQNPYVGVVIREYYYFRAINVLVIVDRFHTDTASRSTTFTSHCETNPVVVGVTTSCVVGTQKALYTALVPSSPTIVKVNESDNGATDPNWQYRIESNNSNPGNVVSYQINTIQFGDDSGFIALTPGIVNSTGVPTTGTYTITIDGNSELVINKGDVSLGGTIKAAGITRSLATTVEPMSITDGGPVWGGLPVPNAPFLERPVVQ